MSGTGLNWNTLAVNLNTFGLGFFLCCIISVDTCDESLAGLGLTDVLDSDVDAFGDNAGVDALVDDNTNCVGGDIKDSTSLSVVELMGHTTVGTAVSNDIDVISLLVDSEESLEADWAVLTVGLREQVSCASSKTEGVWHL